LLVAGAAALAPSLASATTLRVSAKIDDEPQLADRIAQSVMDAEQWLTDITVEALSDKTDGARFFEFVSVGQADYDLNLRLYHKKSEAAWPSGQVLAEFQVSTLAEARPFSFGVLNSLVEEGERPSYKDNWFSKQVRVQIANNSLYRNLLQYVPIKTKVEVRDRNWITTTLAPWAGYSVLLAVRWGPGRMLWFMHCDSEHVGGPILLEAPDRPAPCRPVSTWTTPPKSWESIYVQRVWDAY